MSNGHRITSYNDVFFRNTLASTLLEDPSAWISLKTANGLNISYLWYVLLDVKMGDVLILDCGIVVVQDHCLANTDGLVGTNIIKNCLDTLTKDNLTVPF